MGVVAATRVDHVERAPAINNMDGPTGWRMTPGEGRIPKPTPSILASMAHAGRQLWAVEMALYLDVEVSDWDDLPEAVRDAWMAAARGMYSAIVLHGGGDAEKIA